MATIIEMIREVRDMIGDEGEIVPDTAIIRHLNNAYKDAVYMTRRLFTWEVAVDAGAASVQRPSDLAVLQDASWIAGRERWRLVTKHGYPTDGTDETGDPDELYVVGDTLYLCPAPSTGGTLLLVGVQSVAPLDLNDEPSLPGVDRVMVAYAVWKTTAAITDNLGSAAAKAAAEEYYRVRNEWLLAEAMRYPPTSVIGSRGGDWW